VQSGELLRLATRPIHDEPINFRLATQPEMQRLGRLAEKSVPSANRLDEFALRRVLQDQLGAGTNRVSIRGRTISDETYGQKMIRDAVVAKELDSGPVSIRSPDIHITVVIPIDERIGAPITDVFETGNGRDIRESSGTCVKKTTVPFVSAVGHTVAD
jgi:hypothetical protein